MANALDKMGDALFGSAPQAHTQITPNYDPNQMAMFDAMGNYLTGQIGQTGTPTAQGQKYTDFLQNYNPWAKNITNEAFDPASTEEYFKKVMYPQWEKYTAPAVREEFAGGNYFGSARRKAVTTSLQGVNAKANEALQNMDLQRKAALDQLLQSEPAMAQELINNWDRYNDWIKTPAGQAMIEYLTLKPYNTSWYMDQGKKGLISPLMTAGGAVVGGITGGPFGASVGGQTGAAFGDYLQR